MLVFGGIRFRADFVLCLRGWADREFGFRIQRSLSSQSQSEVRAWAAFCNARLVNHGPQGEMETGVIVVELGFIGLGAHERICSSSSLI